MTPEPKAPDLTALAQRHREEWDRAIQQVKAEYEQDLSAGPDVGVMGR